MSVYIVGINGSPQREGDTAAMLRVALEVAREIGAETELLHVVDAIADQKRPFCVNCTVPCSGVCLKNTKLGEAFDKMRRADGLIIGSPVYFGTVSGQLKSFFDKSRMVRTEKGLLNVVGAGLTVGAARFGGQETTLRAIHDIMLVHGMMVVGDGYLMDDCGHHGGCAQRPALNDQFGLARTRVVAKRIVQVAEATKGIRNRH